MDTLVFTATQAFVNPSYRRWTESPLPITCRLSSSSKGCFLRRSHRTVKIAMPVCNQPFSLRAFHSSAFRVSAADSSSLASSDPVEIEREEGMPIPGTITFRRSATQKHYEYVTDLETLGMGNFSSQMSRKVALSMGINGLPNSESTCTPTSVSIDVKKERRDLRLNGMVRTSLALNCWKCGVPVAERIFGEFSLLLTEEPVVEPTKHRIGVVLGGEAPTPEEEEDLEEALDLDLDDKMHFPKTEKTIDISKYIRDTVHLEIPLQCMCSLSCKGKCTECGINLNERSCDCALKEKNEDRRRRWKVLEKLKEQLEGGR